jgi:hypothetical protein
MILVIVSQESAAICGRRRTAPREHDLHRQRVRQPEGEEGTPISDSADLSLALLSHSRQTVMAGMLAVGELAPRATGVTRATPTTTSKTAVADPDLPPSSNKSA